MTSSLSPSSPQTNATVMASAGTGKTYMLVNRLLRLLLSGAKPEAILAVTFTRKAAAEMQSRLGERLYALASASDDELRTLLHGLELNDPEPAVLERARRLYESLRQGRHTVRTTTFHAFCQEILLRFPMEAEVPPGFVLVDGGSEILRAALDTLLDEASREPDGETAQALQALLDYCGSLDGLERSLSTFIAHRGDWWAYTEECAEPIEFALQRLTQQLNIDPNDDPLATFFTPTHLQQLSEFVELLTKHPGSQNNAAAESIATARDDSQAMAIRFEACRNAFLTAQNSPRSRKASGIQAKKMGAEGEAHFLALHQELSQALLATLDHQLAQNTWHACTAWYRAGSRLLAHFQRLKQEQRQLDFTDLEWSAYRLLNRSESAQWVQYKLDQRIDHLLVDEFQDTNPTQWRLLLPLLEELAAGESERGRSVFLVGDAKQSIYRFRRAEPRLFQAAHEWLAAHLSARSFPLHTSWRSSPVIMDCVNRVFGKDGPLARELRDFVQHNTHHHELWGEVKVLPLVERDAVEESVYTELRNPLQRPYEEPGYRPYQLEGEQIAAEIRRLIDTSTPVTVDGNVRPLRYGDIMILVRKRTHTGYYEQALRRAGIPYLGAERGTLLQSGEVADMVALLEVLLTPDNNLSLATVLRCPLFSCSDQDLIRLARFDRGGWYQRLMTLAPQLEPEEPLALAAILLAHWHQLAGRLPIHDLLDRVFCEGDLLRRYRAAYPPHLGDRVVANLGRFLELALEIDSGRYPSLGHFLARLGEIGQSSDEAPDQAPGSSDSDRVQLLTIHAAKGLEAPVVFLADSALGESPAKPFQTMLEWPPQAARPESFLLLGKKDQQPEAIRQRLEKEQQEQRRETGNLLYVALTRARQHLFISGVRPSGKDESGWYFSLRRALDPSQQIGAEEACVLSHGTIPELRGNEDAAKPTETIAVDPHLSHPLTVEQTLYEIAPSHQHQEQRSYHGDEDGRLRGEIIHRLLQRMSEKDEKNWPQTVTTIAAEFDLDRDDPFFNHCFEECRGVLDDSKLAPLFQPDRGTAVLNEVPLLYRQDGRTVHGIIDRLLIGESEVWIIDYKSHRHATQENMDELAENFRGQLGYYARGIEKLWPQHLVRSFLLFTTPRLLHEI
jgi:ATP-dependent helicase/nuclease subunit A